MTLEMQNFWVVLAVSIAFVGLATAVHLGLFRLLVAGHARVQTVRTVHVAGAVIVALLFHVLEILLFAFGLVLLTESERYGQLVGIAHGDIPNYFYYSTVTYTTLGFGDIVPSGPVRIFTAFESLSGLVLVAWTASIIFSWVLRVVSQTQKSP